jgi:hypothetical protein
MFAYDVGMAPKDINPVQALQILIQRIDKRKSVLVRLGNEMAYRVALAELDIVRSQLVKAQQYFVSVYTETTVRPHR